MNNQLAEPISTHSTDSLAGFRRRIRSPLYQIISYAEIIKEEAPAQHDFLAGGIAEILSACEQALRTTQAITEEDCNGEGEIYRAQHRLLAQYASTVFDQAEQIRAASGRENSPSLIKDTEKLARAAEGLLSSLRGLESPTAVRSLFTGRSAETVAGPTRIVDQQAQQRGLVLVVDDDEGNRDVLSRRLLRDGCDVMLAEGGRQALRMLQRYGFDLVLLDVMMPEMDGPSVLAQIRSNPELRTLPLIMITAVDEMESVVRCIELGADDYLLKPFNAVLLRARVHALLERKRLQDEQRRKERELQESLLEIEHQKRRAEELLQNILPASIALELQANGVVQPMYFEDVTILFADIVGFTRSIEDLSAEELVAILHEYFSAFDKVISRFGLEKLKTIGDCYMVGGGLPERCPSHPVDCVLAALSMLETAKKLAEVNVVKWDLRVGIHTGPVIAGVVGLRKFAFDIWGDAVNFSSRMESSGVPGRINLSQATYGRVKDFFKCEKREKIRIKDGREVDTYLVTGMADRLWSQKAGMPQEAFEQRYRTYFRRALPEFPGLLAQNANNNC